MSTPQRPDENAPATPLTAPPAALLSTPSPAAHAAVPAIAAGAAESRDDEWVTMIEPRGLGELWGRLAVSSTVIGKAASFVDKFWYEFQNGPCLAMCIGIEVGIGFFGIKYGHIPAGYALNIGRAAPYANEAHTLAVAALQKNYDFYERSQFFRRGPGGVIQQTRKKYEYRLRRKSAGHSAHGTRLQTLKWFLRNEWRDMIFQRCKTPALVMALASPLASYLAVSLLHVPLLAALSITYGTQVIAVAPDVVNGFRGFGKFLTHVLTDDSKRQFKTGHWIRAMKGAEWKAALKVAYMYIDQPQLVAPDEELEDLPGAQPAVVTAPARPDGVQRTEVPAAGTPAPEDPRATPASFSIPVGGTTGRDLGAATQLVNGPRPGTQPAPHPGTAPPARPQRPIVPFDGP